MSWIKENIKRFTVEELTAILPEFNCSQSESHKVAKKYGIKQHYVDSIRTLLGYTVSAPRRLSQDMKDKAVELLNDGYSITKTAKAVGCTPTAVIGIAKKHGITPNSPTHGYWTKVKIYKLVDLVNKGYTYQEIANQMEATKNRIANMVQRLATRTHCKRWLAIYDKTGGFKNKGK